MVKFSIIVPHKDDFDNLVKCLNSIKSSFFELFNNYEIIVVDDNSKYFNKNKNLFCNKIIYLNKTVGPGIARNRGAKLAKGKFLIFLDSDIIITKLIAKKIISYTNNFNNSNFDIIQGNYTFLSGHINFFSRYKNIYTHYMIRNFKKNSCISFFLIIKRNIFFKLNGFNYRFNGIMLEDLDFGNRAYSRGFKIVSNNDLFVKHFKKYTFLSFTKNQFKRSLVLTQYFFNKEMPRTILKNKKNVGIADSKYLFRIPFAYLSFSCLILSFFNRIFILFSLLSLIIHFYLTKDFLYFIFKKNEFSFFLKSFFVNIYDSFICGIGIAVGILVNKK